MKLKFGGTLEMMFCKSGPDNMKSLILKILVETEECVKYSDFRGKKFHRLALITSVHTQVLVCKAERLVFC